MKSLSDRRHFQLPKWFIAIYVVVIALLIPWIMYLAYSLPVHHVARHWDLLWVGFDIGLLVILGLTLYLAMKHSAWVILGATSLATMLLIDAWFDILTSRPSDVWLAVLMAIMFELPLAVVSFWMAYRILRNLIGDNRD